MLTHWLCAGTPSTLPPPPSHFLGAAGMCLDAQGLVLAVQERSGPAVGIWKLPGGHCEY
jgi:ADP-ribose pyrophosphatase YjhB (NUDIX family)